MLWCCPFVKRSSGRLRPMEAASLSGASLGDSKIFQIHYRSFNAGPSGAGRPTNCRT
jgi:hypothetical protein